MMLGGAQESADFSDFYDWFMDGIKGHAQKTDEEIVAEWQETFGSLSEEDIEDFMRECDILRDEENEEQPNHGAGQEEQF
jgi:hypothetical protein